MNYQITEIGHVRDGFRLEILEPYRAALKELGQFSHVKVYWWAHKVDTPEARQKLQAELPYAEGRVAGVFACRSQLRPNPIAESTCFMLEVDEKSGIVQLPYIDAYAGTPIIDLKPYIPMSDRVRNVKMAEWMEDWPEYIPESEDEIPAELLEKLMMD